ncbi:MAG: SDR family oxidoreductase [Henriciella sp.]|nr:SDR family oxidoreductase [Henriciella sp.]
MTQTLSNKTALITGGTSGIGYAAAEAMLAEGARVIITGQNGDRVREAAARLGANVIGLVAPSQDASALTRLADDVRARFGGLDILFANAGVTWPAPLGQIDADQAAQQLAINVTGPLLTVQALRPVLNTGASVFFTTSNLDRLGMPGMAVYSASKAALRSVARTLAAELKDAGIRVNTIAPGPVETPIYSKLGMSEAELNEMASGVVANVPLGRFGKPEEIAGAAVFLASDASSFMLGEEITIDGGWSTL